MCILSFIPAGMELTPIVQESLWNGGINNPDGHGYAIASDRGMIIGKSLRLDEALSEFVVARELHPDAPALFHSRWATHGSIRVGNVHPFLVGNSHQTVMAHNGVLPKAAHPNKGDDRSDTAIMAQELIPRQWRKLDKPSVRKSLAQFCGRGNKLVILTVDPKYRNNHYIVNESLGMWDDGIWHSNSDYQYSMNWMQSQSAIAIPAQLEVLSDSDLIDPTQCDYCGMNVNDYGICTTCGTCQDCYEHDQDCLCMIPESLRAIMR